jgi:hypothetical protein
MQTRPHFGVIRFLVSAVQQVLPALRSLGHLTALALGFACKLVPLVLPLRVVKSLQVNLHIDLRPLVLSELLVGSLLWLGFCCERAALAAL